MTTEEAKTILSSAAAAHDRETDALWEQVMKNFFVLRPAGYEAAHKRIRAICNQCIEHADAQADAEEMAEALREEIKTRADAHENVQTSSRLAPSEVIEASYIWCRGETGEVTMDTELSFGQYEGKTIRYLFENARDYANWIISEMITDRPHLATFIAIEEDRRRKEGGGYHVYCRGDECIT